jgi:hypothetical protein
MAYLLVAVGLLAVHRSSGRRNYDRSHLPVRSVRLENNQKAVLFLQRRLEGNHPNGHRFCAAIGFHVDLFPLRLQPFLAGFFDGALQIE